MFKLFNKGSKLSKLEKKHKRLLEESFKLSKVNRAASDQKAAEAEEVLRQIEAIDA